MVDVSLNETINSSPARRQDLYHISLPGSRKDPLWAHAMENATQAAVQVMKGGSEGKEIIMDSQRNITTMIERLSKFTGNNQDDLLKAVQGRVSGFCEHPTLRDIADYILADAHHNYHANDPEFIPVTHESGNTAWIVNNYGTPRELEPSLETPFQGEYQINPYLGYRERAKECKETYSDPKGYMTARAAKVIPNPSGGFIYESSVGEEIMLTQTTDSYWWHTDVSHFEKIWDHIEVLYTDLTRLVSSDAKGKMTETKSELIAQIGWWYFQAMPYTRGSGGIGISLLQSLFDYCDITNPPYKEGIAPDLEAFVTPLPLYVKNFTGFYSGKLETSKN